MLGGCRTHLAELKVVRLLDGARGRARCTAAGRGATRLTPATRAPWKFDFARTETRDATAVAPITGIAVEAILLVRERVRE